MARCPFSRCPRVFVDGDGRRASSIIYRCVCAVRRGRAIALVRAGMLVGGGLRFRIGEHRRKSRSFSFSG